MNYTLDCLDKDLPPVGRQVITWTYDHLFPIGLATDFNDI